MSKIDTCRHRSVELQNYGPSCCPTRSQGYRCNERSIEGITSAVCDPCEFYSAKDEPVVVEDPFLAPVVNIDTEPEK